MVGSDSDTSDDEHSPTLWAASLEWYDDYPHGLTDGTRLCGHCLGGDKVLCQTRPSFSPAGPIPAYRSKDTTKKGRLDAFWIKVDNADCSLRCGWDPFLSLLPLFNLLELIIPVSRCTIRYGQGNCADG